jgi:hypothetical protein
MAFDLATPCSTLRKAVVNRTGCKPEFIDENGGSYASASDSAKKRLSSYGKLILQAPPRGGS